MTILDNAVDYLRYVLDLLLRGFGLAVLWSLWDHGWPGDIAGSAQALLGTLAAVGALWLVDLAVSILRQMHAWRIER